MNDAEIAGVRGRLERAKDWRNGHDPNWSNLYVLDVERLLPAWEALLRVQVEEINGRLCARPDTPEDRCCDNCRETWRLVDAALNASSNSHSGQESA